MEGGITTICLLGARPRALLGNTRSVVFLERKEASRVGSVHHYFWKSETCFLAFLLPSFLSIRKEKPPPTYKSWRQVMTFVLTFLLEAESGRLVTIQCPFVRGMSGGMTLGLGKPRNWRQLIVNDTDCLTPPPKALSGTLNQRDTQYNIPSMSLRHNLVKQIISALIGVLNLDYWGKSWIQGRWCFWFFPYNFLVTFSSLISLTFTKGLKISV